jgi:hypothetical protein
VLSEIEGYYLGGKTNKVSSGEYFRPMCDLPALVQYQALATAVSFAPKIIPLDFCKVPEGAINWTAITGNLPVFMSQPFPDLSTPFQHPFNLHGSLPAYWKKSGCHPDSGRNPGDL